MQSPPDSDLAKRFAWSAMLTLVTVATSLALACGTPFAALGALGALFLPRRDAMVLVGINWLANQAIGFALLHYPHTRECYLGGADLAAAAGLCTIAAMFASHLFRKAPAPLKAIVCFATACVSFEGVLFALSPSASATDFALPVVSYIVCVNSTAFVGLLLMKTVAARLGYAFPLAKRLVDANGI
jgi:hypothetical protein